MELTAFLFFIAVSFSAGVFVGWVRIERNNFTYKNTEPFQVPRVVEEGGIE